MSRLIDQPRQSRIEPSGLRSFRMLREILFKLIQNKKQSPIRSS